MWLYYRARRPRGCKEEHDHDIMFDGLRECGTEVCEYTCKNGVRNDNNLVLCVVLSIPDR